MARHRPDDRHRPGRAVGRLAIGQKPRTLSDALRSREFVFCAGVNDQSFPSQPALNDHDGLASVDDGMNLPLILRQFLARQRGRRGRIVHCILPARLQQNHLVRIAIGDRARNTTHRDGVQFIEEIVVIKTMSGIANPMSQNHQGVSACMVGPVEM